MPTLPPEPSSDALRQVAQSFGTDAARYDRTRPPYPAELIARIAAASPGPAVLDVGCGTGIAARQLRDAGCTVLGVEPDPRMAETARAGGIPVEVATFEQWEPAGRVFDAVVAGQAWHWVDAEAGAAQAARVLRPGGLFAAFWHVFQPPPAVGEAFATAFRQAAPAAPVDVSLLRQPADAYRMMLDTAAAGLRAAGGFSAPERWSHRWELPYTRDEWLALLPTQGLMTRLAPEQVARVQAGVGAAIDAIGGGFTMAYETVAIAARREAA